MSDRVEFVASEGRSSINPRSSLIPCCMYNTLHMIGPEGSKGLLKHCYNLISPGGRLIIQAQYLNDDRVSPRWATLLNLFQRVATPAGRNHAIGETTQWLQDAGFTNVSFARFSAWNVNSCLIGQRPK